MSKPLMLGIGLPFEDRYSSCLYHTPKTFEWTANPLYNSEYTVYVDFGILQAANAHHESCIGWMSESSAVLQYLITELSYNIQLRSRFKVIFTHDLRLIHLFPSLFRYCPNGSNLPWLDPLDYKFVNKTKVCSIIASDKKHLPGHRMRHRIIAENTWIDAYGSGTPSGRIPTKDPALAPYMFSVVIENDSYDHYVTEKLLDCFATRTIPIYWGGETAGTGYNQKGLLNLSKIDLAMLKDEDYARHLYEINQDAIEDNWQAVQRTVMADDQLYAAIKGLH